MTVGLVWIRDDFRLENNSALIHASKNHDTVSRFIYLIKNFLTIEEKLKNGGLANL